VVLLAELLLTGIVTHAAGESANGPTDVGAPGPDSVVNGGPIVRIDPTGAVTTRSMPAKTVALTFDDGPDPQWTPQVLAVLARHHAHATFFEIGSHVNEHPDLTRQVVAAGNEVGVHTFTHPDLTQTAAWRLRLEISLCANAIAAATGQTPTLMRPPYSSTPDAVTAGDFQAMAQVAGSGYLIVLADQDTEDWSRPGVPAIVKAAIPPAGQGAVIMLHDGGGDRSQTVAALDQILTRLDQAGYHETTVSAAMGLPAAPAASTGMKLRGNALRWAQLIGRWLTTGMGVFLVIGLGLSFIRLLVQVILARVHVRRTRQHVPHLRYLGPVTVIVPAYNEQANIAATVRSLVDNDYPNVNVVVVDDGSTDATAETVRRLALPNVTVITQPNAGKPAALNTGIEAARTELLVLVDGDTVLERTAIGELLQPLADMNVGAVSGNAKVANRRGLLGRWQHLEYVMGFNLDRRMYELARCMPTIPGAIGAFRRSTLADAGNVSADTLAEDTDLTMAILRAGWEVVYAERAIAWTEAPSSLRQLWRQRYRWCYGTLQAIWKHRHAVTERGPGGRLGRRALPYLLGFQVFLPLVAPAIDICALYGLFFLPLRLVAAFWILPVAAQMLVAAYALRLDRERLGPIWTLPLQQVVYRQLLYLVVIQSVVTALSGIRLRWHRITRTGEARLGGQPAPAGRSSA
jgi:cellulose synthase/poly-beta-1,6-N-acetylglucosamine synthase-like glycosyltransferase/peptidoglycan/xylan/chitin deacetylase (PgdA/CDA1 family)